MLDFLQRAQLNSTIFSNDGSYKNDFNDCKIGCLAQKPHIVWMVYQEAAIWSYSQVSLRNANSDFILYLNLFD